MNEQGAIAKAAAIKKSLEAVAKPMPSNLSIAARAGTRTVADRVESLEKEVRLLKKKKK